MGEALTDNAVYRNVYSFVVDNLGAEWAWLAYAHSPSLINLSLFKEMLVGWKLADAIVSLGSLDFNMGEVDR